MRANRLPLQNNKKGDLTTSLKENLLDDWSREQSYATRSNELRTENLVTGNMGTQKPSKWSWRPTIVKGVAHKGGQTA